MKIIAEKEIFEKMAGLNIGVVIAKGIDNKTQEKRISKLLKEVEDMIKMDFVPEKLAKHRLISPWRAAYFDTGEEPKAEHTNVEKMMKAILSGEGVKRINKVADLVNYLSLKHIIPMSAHDLGRMTTDIEICKAKGRESINTDEGGVKHARKGEIIIKDSNLNVVSRKWGLEISYGAKTRDATKDVLIFIFGLKPVYETKLTEICRETADLMSSLCNGETKYFVLDKDNSEVEA